MSRRLMAVGLAAMLASAAAAAERTWHRAYDVAPGAVLRLTSYRGAVTITESDRPVIDLTVRARTYGASAERAAWLLAGVEFHATHTPQGVDLEVTNPRESGAHFVWNDEEAMNLAFQITVPRQCDLELAVRDAAVTIGNLRGRLRADVGTGTIFFRRIEGPIEAHVDTGDVVVSRCVGDVVASVREGAIRIGTVTGRAELRNGSGDIEVMTALGPVSAHAVAGDIQVAFAREVSGPSRLETNGGNVFASVDEAAQLAVEARATWGRVRLPAACPWQTTRQGARFFVGALNGGGPQIELRARGGDVVLRCAAAPFEETIGEQPGDGPAD